MKIKSLDNVRYVIEILHIDHHIGPSSNKPRSDKVYFVAFWPDLIARKLLQTRFVDIFSGVYYSETLAYAKIFDDAKRAAIVVKQFKDTAGKAIVVPLPGTKVMKAKLHGAI